MTEDENHLDLLAVFHWVVGGLTALFACFPLIHVGLGLAMVFGKLDGKNPPPAWIGWFFVVFGGMAVLCGWTAAIAIITAGRKLKRRKSWMYCVVIGALECALMPFGTILGVFTIIVLMRDSVKQLFAANARPGFAGEPPSRAP